MNKKTYGIIFVFLSAVFFSLGGIFIKLNTWGSITINGMRSLFAMLVMLTYMKITKHKFVVNKSVLFGAFAFCMETTFFVLATKMTSSANAIVLQFTMPVYVVFLLWIFWKKKPDSMSVITVIASFIGICFFFLGSLTPSGLYGNIFALISGLFYAIVFLNKKIPKADFQSSAVIAFGGNFLIGLPFLLQEEVIFSSANILTVVALGIVQMGMAYVCLNIGLTSVQPVAASLISMIEPILNPVIVAIFYHEFIPVTGIIGAVIVIASATFYNLMTIKMESKK